MLISIFLIHSFAPFCSIPFHDNIALLICVPGSRRWAGEIELLSLSLRALQEAGMKTGPGVQDSH